MKKSERAREKEEALAFLRLHLPHGSTVYTVLRAVSRSGMSRKISLYTVDKDGKLWDIGNYVAKALDSKPVEFMGSWVLVAGGCGMDMGYHLVSSLAHALFGYISPDDKSKPYTNCYSLTHHWA
jgi:hypothetical protein